MKHLDKREDFSTDEDFANFRNLILGNKKSKMFFRSASATRNLYGRMDTVKKLMKEQDIKTTIDFTNVESRCFSDNFGYNLVTQFRKIITKDGPYIIQCDAGKKRTGFASILLEMLSGTDYSYIVQDYIESYINNNGLDMTSSHYIIERIREQKIDKTIQFIDGTNRKLSGINFKKSAKSYLLKYGLSRYEITALQEKLKQ